jgi:hypothetical protein
MKLFISTPTYLHMSIQSIVLLNIELFIIIKNIIKQSNCSYHNKKRPKMSEFLSRKMKNLYFLFDVGIKCSSFLKEDALGSSIEEGLWTFASLDICQVDSNPNVWQEIKIFCEKRSLLRKRPITRSLLQIKIQMQRRSQMKNISDFV